MRYADRADLLDLLQLDPARHAAKIARLERIENGVADAIDAKVGHGFGVVPVPETRSLISRIYGSVVLSWPARSVVSLSIDGEVVDPLSYSVPDPDRNGYIWQIRLRGLEPHWVLGYYCAVEVAAVWSDQPITDVPDDIREAATFITADQYRALNASPVGEIGPEGLSVTIRNPWSFTTVKEAINRHRVHRARVGV